ncbi:hypothetical protein CesoFtcFv8_004433 [Champsocephalus esox]|uniref:Uncharacterized protein n=1 Tax=Champsocephalus esox TaxID=159716 RepID=A0AAN8HCI8_9TELE|nr:hypothetical protein CesoFtcFv8_004433 [Champsocephalus esox]
MPLVFDCASKTTSLSIGLSPQAGGGGGRCHEGEDEAEELRVVVEKPVIYPALRQTAGGELSRCWLENLRGGIGSYCWGNGGGAVRGGRAGAGGGEGGGGGGPVVGGGGAGCRPWVGGWAETAGGGVPWG